MTNEIKEVYDEARAIASRSSRGAAALLRLAVQMLCQQLGQPGKDLNRDIGALVKDGLPPKVQQALDIVRVIGNESVHPGQIDSRDDSEVVANLFKLVNIIAEDRITQPAAIAQMYADLPASKLKGIETRDNS